MPESASPIDWSASEIARRVSRRDISASEVTRAFIERIEQVNPLLNAVVVPRFEQALAEAAKIDAELSGGAGTAGQASSGIQQPLLGVPITLKECFYLADTPSTIGINNAEHLWTIDTDGILV